MQGFFNIFSKIYPLCCHGNQSNSAIWTKFIQIIEDYSRNISVKKYLNICSETEKIADLHFSHYKSVETISCHSNQSLYPIGTKNIIICSPPPPAPSINAICEIWKQSASRLQRRCRLKKLTDGRQWMPTYTICSPMSHSAQAAWFW